MATATSPELCLVTGASGYIAGHVIKQLLERGEVRVRGTVRSLKNEKNEKLRSLVPDAKYPLELVEGDLLNAESWIEAVKGCSKVYHVASPFPRGTPRDENEVITPAVEGTLNVLKACAEAGTVKRVVFTSSIAAVSNGMNGENGRTYTSDDWSIEENCGSYEKSKLLAEKAAWDFVKQLEEDKKFELVAINAAVVFGPFASPTSVNSTSVSIISDILNNKIPAFPRVSMPSVDVRDVAKAHLAAMEKPEAAGNRFVLYSKSIWMRDMADTIAAEFKPMGYKISSMNLPKFGLWIVKWFSADAKQMYPLVDKEFSYDTTKLKDILGIEPIDLNATIIDTCYSLIEYGVVPKTANYRNPKSTEAETAIEQPEETPKAEPATEQNEPTKAVTAQTAQEESPEEPVSKQNESTEAKSTEEETQEGASNHDEPKSTEVETHEEGASNQDEPTEPKSVEEETQEGASNHDEPKSTEVETQEEGASNQDEPTEPKSVEEETQEGASKEDVPTEPKSVEEETQETTEQPASKQDEKKEESSPEEY